MTAFPIDEQSVLSPSTAVIHIEQCGQIIDEALWERFLSDGWLARRSIKVAEGCSGIGTQMYCDYEEPNPTCVNMPELQCLHVGPEA